ncbi:MerR family transcriptional regulator [Enterococcus sp. LJL99]
MYKINEFSRITGLPPSTLRYYDREGMLRPSYRDEATNYRYYGQEEYEKAKILTMLRKNNFSVAEMKDVLLTISTYDDLPFYFAEKKKKLLAEMDSLKKQVKKLESLSSASFPKKSEPTYQVSFVEIIEQSYLFKNLVGEYEEMGVEVDALYSKAGSHVNGPLFLLDEFIKETMTYRLALPIANPKKFSQENQAILKSGKGLRVYHEGPYETINNAYKYLIDYVNRQNLEVDQQFITRFIKAPGKLFRGNEESYLTEIILPLKIVENGGHKE